MKKILFPLVLTLMLGGCASQKSQHVSLEDDREQDEDHRFFYGTWFHPEKTPEDYEDHKFFYGN